MSIYWINVLACVWGFVQGNIGINSVVVMVSFRLFAEHLRVVELWSFLLWQSLP